MLSLMLAGCQVVLSGALLFAAYATAYQPDVPVAALRTDSLVTAILRRLMLLLPALEIGLALAVLMSPPALLPWMMGSVTGMLLLVGARGVWGCVRRFPPLRGCFGAEKRVKCSVALACHAGLVLLGGIGTTLSLWIPGLAPGLPVWGMALVAISGAALMAFVVHRRTTTRGNPNYHQTSHVTVHTGIPQTPARRRLLQFFGAASGAIMMHPFLRDAPVSDDEGATIVAQRTPTPPSAPADTLNGCRLHIQPQEGVSDSSQYIRCSVQVCYCTSCFEVYDSIDKSWTSIATFACYDSCDGTLCSTPTWSYIGRVCRQLGCP